MTATLRIGGFAAIVAVVFAAAALAGSRIDPSVDESGGEHEGGTTEMNAQDTHTDKASHGGHETDAGAPPPGLAVAHGNMRLVPESASLARDDAAGYRFRIVDEDGRTVRDFDVEHERRMHLIMVRRDFAGFQHLHPRQLDDGSWETTADLSDAGVYRVFADFSSADKPMTLAADLFVAGEFTPQDLPAMTDVAEAGDGYEVRIDSATPQPGGQTAVDFTVMRNGQEVAGVEPYLGADGHLVALREHDQAFLHTHPEGKAGGSGPIRFEVAYPTAGRYRLFLQFRHGGAVRTAAFTQEVGDVEAKTSEPTAGGHDEAPPHGH